MIKCWYAVPDEINDCNNVTLDMGRSKNRECFLGQRRLVRQVWSRDFATHKACSRNSTLSGLSMESSLDLGMSLPSSAGHNGQEVPPKHGQLCGYKGTLLTGLCQLSLQRWHHDHCKLPTFNSPQKEIRVEIRNKALCALGKPRRTGLLIVRYFQVKILWAQILASSCT